MKIYLVGGAVRDQLLGLPAKEKDWVVVGASVHDMLQLGFRQVGKDFPVFLHPKTQEEYALARKERKTGKGYTGFSVEASPNVTLEEDLLRRDITINAMALDEKTGTIIDPYHGQDDLNHRLLRHVSAAFSEDPVRILRVARFAARFDFEVAPETYHLMQAMVNAGEVDALVAERVWKECERALNEKNPIRFFEVLQQCGADKILFPAFSHQGLAALIQTSKKTAIATIRLAALCYTLTAKEIQTFTDRYRIPHDYKDLVIMVNRFYPLFLEAKNLNAVELTNLLQQLDAFRREERFHAFLLACQAISLSSEDFLLHCFNVAKNIEIKTHIQLLKGKQIAEKITQLRTTAIQQFLSQTTDPSASA